MGRDILSEFGPERSRGRSRTSGNTDYDGDGGLGDQRDVMNYKGPTRVTTPYDPKSAGLHGDNCGMTGSQGPYAERKQSSGGPGLGGDEIRRSGSQGKR